jgi:hypothetical protein
MMRLPEKKTAPIMQSLKVRSAGCGLNYGLSIVAAIKAGGADQLVTVFMSKK